MTTDEQIEAGLDLGDADFQNGDPATRAAFEQLLPSLRQLPGFPNGSDAAIVAMSRPRAFTACPNPYGADVIRTDEPTDRLVSAPYATDISSGKGPGAYWAHNYPTKVPHEAIMRFILHYTEPGDLVLDGFCGSGMSGYAAQACGAPDKSVRAEIERANPHVRWGARKAYLQDLAPTATFISAGLNLPVDVSAFEAASRDLLARFDRELGWMYETKTPDGRPAKVDFTLWSEVFTCPHCAGEVVFYANAYNAEAGSVRDSFTCPACGASLSKNSLLRRKVPISSLAGDTFERIEMRPVRIFYRAGKEVGNKAPSPEDLEVLRRIATLKVHGFPTDDLPLATMVHGSRLQPKGFSRVHHLWGDRAIAALATIWGWAKEFQPDDLRTALLFWIEQAFWTMSWMNRYQRQGFSQVNKQLPGVYYIPSIHAEPSLTYSIVGTSPIRGKRQSLVNFWRSSPGKMDNVRISTGSSEYIGLPDESVDYIFVDPPFGANIPYSDLALVIESWHRLTTSWDSEATMDSFKQRGLPDYTRLMSACFVEFARVLKPGRWITIEFSNSDNSVWLGIQQALANAGVVVADTRIFDKELLSFRQVTATNAVKKDLIISAYKPRTEVAERIRLSSGSEEGVWEFVREHLAHLETVSAAEIRERHADRLFDRVVAYHVANGIAVPMSLNEFREGLDQKFNRADGMYFLPRQEEEYQRYRLTVPRATQETAFITNEGSAVAWIRRLLEAGPRTYSEIMPAYFKEVQTGLETWEAMPELRDLLSENFLQDDEGRWFVPDTTDAAQMERLHNQALFRIFAEYARGKGKLGTVRSEAIRVGFAKAWNDRDFESIYAVGRRLPEDFFVTETALHHFFRAAERHVSPA